MIVNYYECVICLSLNHASRLHCQNCGTVPKQYSVIKVPMVIKIDRGNNYGTGTKCVPVLVAFGSERASQKRISRVGLRTVQSTYYAEE